MDRAAINTQHIAAAETLAYYLPMQNVLKIRSSTSSV